MPDPRKVTSMLTGLAFLFQTLFLPLAGGAQSNDPIRAVGFMMPRKPPGSKSKQATQTSKNPLVRVCVPPDLVRYSWTYPYPGSEMDDFKNLLGSYIHAHGDPRVQYRIKDNAFEIFSRARHASAPFTPDPGNLLEEVSADLACPPNYLINTIEVTPHDSPADPPAPRGDLAPAAAAITALAVAQTLGQKDDVALKCDQLATPPDDPAKSGPGVPFEQINVSEALPVCQQAATRQPPQARYQFLYGRVLEAAKRYQDAGRQYALAEQSNFPLAALRLGRLYASGQGVTKNWDEAYKWYLKAANSGLPDGYANIASLFAQGNPPNYAEALKWAEKAAQSGSGVGSTQSGWHYQFGQGVPKDPARAAQFYKEAAQRGNMQGQYLLGLLYFQGDGVTQDYGTAASLFQQAAQQGYADAQDQLGNLYLRGRGVAANDQTAFSWFMRAAQAGKADAQFWVGAMYDNGQGVSQNKSSAVGWYRKAAEQGDPYAMTQLGYHLRAGEGVAWSEREAMQWFRRAADKGDADAQTALGWGYMQGFGQDQGQGVQDYRQAFYWLSKAAEQKDAAAAQLNLGVLYEKGWGVGQDSAKSNELYRQAARSPYPQIANAAKTYMRNSQMATASSSSKDTDAMLGLVVFGLGALAIGALLGGPSNSPRSPAPAPGTTSDTSNSNDQSTQILQEHIASENAARETAAAERQEDRDRWSRTERCGFNANVNCF